MKFGFSYWKVGVPLSSKKQSLRLVIAICGTHTCYFYCAIVVYGAFRVLAIVMVSTLMHYKMVLT